MDKNGEIKPIYRHKLLIFRQNREDMAVSSLDISENLEAKVPNLDVAFPYYACRRELAGDSGRYVPWHWHSEVQFVIVCQGTMRLRTGNHTYILQEGEGAFINSDMLHYKEAVSDSDAVILNQIFAPELISGVYKSVFAQKYVIPVLESRDLEAVIFRPWTDVQKTILELLCRSYEAAEKKEWGYEFEVRNALSSVWRLMFREVEQDLDLQVKRVAANPNEKRVKNMMLFIQENYQDKISLKQIAESANISERECLRCFKQNLNTTPFTYLLEYRIRMASKQLLETDRTITEIAMACGFAGISYFGKNFKSMMGCTPSAYRMMHRRANQKIMS